MFVLIFNEEGARVGRREAGIEMPARSCCLSFLGPGCSSDCPQWGWDLNWEGGGVGGHAETVSETHCQPGDEEPLPCLSSTALQSSPLVSAGLGCHQSELSLATGGLQPGLQAGLPAPGRLEGWRRWWRWWLQPDQVCYDWLPSVPPLPAAFQSSALQSCQSFLPVRATKSISRQKQQRGTSQLQPTTTVVSYHQHINILTSLISTVSLPHLCVIVV